MYNFNEIFPDYDVTTDGKVFKNGAEVTPFKSNKYLQVVLFDTNHNQHVLGVHTVVAMKYIKDFYKGCVVHHLDEDPHNNNVDNLQILSRKQHSYLHNKDNRILANYNKLHGPVNKGKKMSEEFCKKCSESAKKRGFNGNQYVKKNSGIVQQVSTSDFDSENVGSNPTTADPRTGGNRHNDG